MENRAGRTITVPNKRYVTYEPNKLPNLSELEITSEMIDLLGEASKLLGILDGMSKSIPNIDLFISSYVRKEAILSSQIEGTQTSLIDVLDPSIDENANQDVLDVVNYTKALNFALNKLKNYPLCNTLLKQTHEILLSDTRGSNKNPGEFRKTQNWIGSQGCTLNDARYIPPTPEFMIEAMSDLEKYINYNEDNILIKTSLAHYQFETIHPFLDGNGRIGRMLITLILLNNKTISQPIIYVSYYLKKNRVEYYDRLESVRKTGNYEQWILFFLKAIKETCKDSIQTIEKILSLKSKCDKLIQNESKSTKKVYGFIWENPIIEITKTSTELDLSFNTVNSAIKKLISYNILKLESKTPRNKVFHFDQYLDILKKDTENL